MPTPHILRPRWFTMILRNPSDDRSRSTSIILGWNVWTWSRRNRIVSSLINENVVSSITVVERTIEEPFFLKREPREKKKKKKIREEYYLYLILFFFFIILKLYYSNWRFFFCEAPQFLSNLYCTERLTDTYIWLVTITRFLNRNLYGVMKLCIRSNSNFWVFTEVEYQCPQYLNVFDKFIWKYLSLIIKRIF